MLPLTPKKTPVKKRKTGDNMEVDGLVSIPYHGNYCGPGWSAGKAQPSVAGAAGTAIDEFDESCRLHDLVYAKHGPITKADIKFAIDNLSSMEPKRMVAGAVVGMQGLVRMASGGDPMETDISDSQMVNLLVGNRSQSFSGKSYPGKMRYARRGKSIRTRRPRRFTKGRKRVPYRKKRFRGKNPLRPKKIVKYRKNKRSNFSSGCIYKFETGRVDTFNKLKCGYYMFGMPVQKFKDNFFRALTRYIFLKMGYDFQDWDLPIASVVGESGSILKISFNYRSITSAGGDANQNLLYDQSSTPASSPTDSVKQLALNLAALLENNWSAAGHMFTQLRAQIVTVSPADTKNSCTIDMRNMVIVSHYYGKIKIQNNTLARSGTDTAETDNVYNNPLDCIKYKNFGWRNYIKASVMDGVGSTDEVVIDQDSGISTITTLQNDYDKFPAPSTLGAKKAFRFVMMPGEIKYTDIVFKVKIGLNKLITKIPTVFNEAFSDFPLDFGTMIVIGMEKSIHATLNGPDVVTSCQYEHTFKTKVYCKKKIGPLQTVEIVAPS